MSISVNVKRKKKVMAEAGVNSAGKKRNHITVLGEFVGHLAIGSAMFAALLAFGGSLNLLVHWIEPLIGDESFSSAMKLVEKILMYADVVFLVWWAIFSTYKAIREMVVNHDEGIH